MVRGLSGCPFVVLALLAAPAHAAHVAPRTTDAPPAGPAATTLHRPARPVPAPAGADAEQAARFHLKQTQGVADAELLFVHDTGRGGVIVGLRPTVAGVEIARADQKVLLDRNHALLAIAGVRPRLAAPRAHHDGAAARQHAVAAALRALHGLDVAGRLAASREPARAGFTYVDVAIPAPIDLALRRPARVKPVWYPVDGAALVPAHMVEIQAVVAAGREPAAHAVIVDAGGRILHRKDLVAHESFSYRVYATPDGRPQDGPTEDRTPHPDGAPTGDPAGPAFPALIEMEGFNTNPDGVPDPWLPPGAKETVGNNVDAYADWLDPNGLSGTKEHRGKINGLSAFDWIYDTTLEPLADQQQSMAAIVSLFYVNNWMHDWWYDSGFDEAAGNAQADNFGRGGAGGDPLLAEAQDAALEGARNNANMSTPADGESPTMQMYLWTPLVESVQLFADPPDQEFAVAQAAFGPRMYDVTAPLVIVDDGSDAPTEGCQPPVNAVSGKIVLIDRGGDCTFEVKATHAQNAGAVGVIFVDSLDDMEAFQPGQDPDLADPTIPGQGVSKANGQLLKDAVLDSPVSAHMVGATSPERDGTLDNLIVAHEWGHYIHHRLTTCGTNQCGGHSEGWGDFNAVMHALREGDDLHGTYASSTYGAFDTAGYFGLRRVAYTVDMAKNPLTFKHVADNNPLPSSEFINNNPFPNAEVHNAGEVWATMMWEAYIALLEAHADEPFEDIRRRMGDYVVGGMMMTATDPTYGEQRDGILAAARAADEDDFMTLAAAFARRGLGTCAVSPARMSETNAGVVEDFELRPNGTILAATLRDDRESCDDDGFLDQAELGTITLKVRNAGILPMSGGTLSLAASSDALLFPNGPEVAVPDLEPQAEAEVTVEVAIVDDPPDIAGLTVTAALTTPNGCEDAAEFKLPAVLNGDVATDATTTDDVDAPITPWQIGGDVADIWSRIPGGGGGALWHGANFGSVSDTTLTSPTLEVGDGAPLEVSFIHTYKFEATDGTFWDGGVIELSADDGQTWADISMWADPGYDGTLTNEVNPLVGRLAFSGESDGFPAPKKLTLNLGTGFAGKNVRLRFRIATDGYVGAEGWYIDDIAVTGILNTPFSKWVPDACGGAPSPTTGDAPTTGDVPTTGDAPPPDSDGSGGGSSGTPDPGGVDDEGCGCAASGPPSLAPLLALLGLFAPRRRRRGA